MPFRISFLGRGDAVHDGQIIGIAARLAKVVRVYRAAAACFGGEVGGLVRRKMLLTCKFLCG